MTSARRLNFADMAKGIAILIVVFYHLSAPGIINTVCTHLIPAALLLFFFFSGFFYKPRKRTFQENLAARTKALIIPFFQIFSAVLGCRNHLSSCHGRSTA